MPLLGRRPSLRKRNRNVTNPTDTTGTTTPTSQNAVQIGEDAHNIWPLWYILGGLAVGFGWLWGNTLQIQTSEAWILQLKDGIALAPHFAILGQIANFFGGNLTQSQVIADTWG